MDFEDTAPPSPPASTHNLQPPWEHWSCIVSVEGRTMVMDEAGSEGWELVSAQFVEFDHETLGFFLFFKRPA